MRKILIRLGITILIPFIILITFILFPGISYAHKTVIGDVTIYHHQPLDPGMHQIISNSLAITKTSELYDADFKVQICLDDGSVYPSVIQLLKGRAFGYGLANKVILKSEANVSSNQALGYGQAWNLQELIAHEMIHTYQYNHYGFGTLRTPTWKLEGYAEYQSRKKGQLKDLGASIDLLLSERSKAGNVQWFWIQLEDGTGLPSQYLRDKILIQYLMEVEGLTYQEIKNEERAAQVVEAQALTWHQGNQ